jgi:hypothetical protein
MDLVTKTLPLMGVLFELEGSVKFDITMPKAARWVSRNSGNLEA